jgi:hypothetical protein
MALALLWFALGHRRRDIRPWEAALVIAGGAAAMLRDGNLWLFALALLAPLGRQIALARPNRTIVGAAALTGLLAAGTTLLASRPPTLPPEAVRAVEASTPPGRVFADWRWAPQLQRDLGARRTVLAAGGLASETPDFWLDYVRVVHDYERWPTELGDMNVDLVVLDATQLALIDQVRTSSEWRVLYDTADAFVAERAGS